MSTSVTSVTNHFPSAENGFSTTTSASVSSGATTVQLNSVAGYDNGEVVVFVIDPTDATKKQTFTGIVDTAGTQITSVVWTAGSNQSHALGATVVDYATATHISMISKGLMVEHKQTGAHGNITADSITTNAAGSVDFSETPLATTDIADDAVTDAKLDYPRFWQEIARTTLTVAGDTITVSDIPARKYLKIIFNLIPTGGTISGVFTFNSDSGSNYARRLSIGGGADSTSLTQTSVPAFMSASATFQHHIYQVTNVTTSEKVGYGTVIETSTAGAGTAPNRNEGAFKWVNTSSQISSITVTNAGTGDFAIGSEVVVLGHN
jgi:hypothetical protein